MNFCDASLSFDAQATSLKTNPLIQFGALTSQRAIEEGEVEPVDPVITAMLVFSMIKDTLREAFLLGDAGQAKQLEEGPMSVSAQCVKSPKVKLSNLTD